MAKRVISADGWLSIPAPLGAVENGLRGSSPALWRAKGARTSCFPTLLEGRCSLLDPAGLGRDIIALQVQTAVPHWCHTPNLKHSLIHLHVILPKQEAMPTPLLAAGEGYLLFRTCGHILGRRRILNLFLDVAHATGRWGPTPRPGWMGEPKPQKLEKHRF